MSKPIIKVEDLSKAYQIGQIGTGTLSRDLERFWTTKIRGQEDPFLKIGEANDRAVKGTSNIVWSLRDIGFEINQGDAVGIIGKNGAGKSTLLKLLSRVTAPTTGSIKVKGRIASLLEVGTGFHPELSGKENIYLNGAILGMRKKEITRKLDEIIEFSGVERYIDTPVKRYSSGMYVRLAFAVAAHLESEILIVDEVLAVGDAEFQKKCLGKMQDISKGEGRTVLFVSHNMAAVQNLCNTGMLIENGQLAFQGDVDATISRYLQGSVSKIKLQDIKERKGNGKVRFEEVNIFGTHESQKPISGAPLSIVIKLNNPKKIPSNSLRFDMRIDDDFGQRLVWVSTTLKEAGVSVDAQYVKIEFPNNPFNSGTYYATLHLSAENNLSDWIQNAFDFEVDAGDFYGTGKNVPTNQSKMLVDFNLKFNP